MATSLNPDIQHNWGFQRRETKDYIEGIRLKDRTILSQCITLGESPQLNDKIIVNEILDNTNASWVNNPTLRIGITGPPGVGKSSFIERLGSYITHLKDESLAVLPIDPSSAESQGSILGDLSRMELLSKQSNVYIRPNPNNQHLGGLTHNTATSILLCEAAGYNTTIIESVGVGQSEIQIHSMADIVILLMQPGSGDYLQGIKKGVMEVADILIVNKVDGEMESLGNKLTQELQQLFPNKHIIKNSNVYENYTHLDTLFNMMHDIYKESKRRQTQHHLLIQAEIKAAILDHAKSKNYYPQLRNTISMDENPSSAYVKLRQSLENHTF